MRKIPLILFALVSFAITSYAQPTEGTIQLGTSTALFGGLNNIAAVTEGNSAGIAFTRNKTKFDDDTQDGPNETIINLSPHIGFAVSDGLVLGVNLDLLYLKAKDDDDDESKTTATAIGPFARYFIPAGGNAVPFIQGSASFGRATSQFNDNDKNKTNIVSLNLGVGAAFFFNESVSLDIMAGYSHNRSKDPDSEFDIISISNGFGLACGMSFFFPNGSNN